MSGQLHLRFLIICSCLILKCEVELSCTFKLIIIIIITAPLANKTKMNVCIVFFFLIYCMYLLSPLHLFLRHKTATWATILQRVTDRPQQPMGRGLACAPVPPRLSLRIALHDCSPMLIACCPWAIFNRIWIHDEYSSPNFKLRLPAKFHWKLL